MWLCSLPAARGRRVQVRSGARTCRGSPRTVFKIEPEMDIDYGTLLSF